MRMTNKVLKAVLIFDADDENPERILFLKSGLHKQFIEIYEDPVDLSVRHVSEDSMSKDVIDLLKI